MAFAAQKLLVVPRWRECCDEVLGRLGEAASASRSYIFEFFPDRDGTLLVSQRFEWVDEGVPSHLERPERQNVPVLAADYGR